jgi:glycosyltransferase involved in cell wall biosynthesis
MTPDADAGDSRYRVLVVTPVLPWPMNRGNRVRIMNTVVELAKKHSVTVLCLLHPDDAEGVLDARRALADYCGDFQVVPLPRLSAAGRLKRRIGYLISWAVSGAFFEEYYYSQPAIIEAVLREVNSDRYDLVLSNYWFTAHDAFLEARPATLCDTHDLFAQKLQREVLSAPDWLRRGFVRRQARHALESEGAALNAFDCVLVVHDADAAAAERLGVRSAVRVMAHLPSIGQLEYHSPGPSAGRILFFGALHSDMNRDALSFAVRDVLPLVRKEIPGAQLIVRGSGGDSGIRELATAPGVTFEGEMPSLAQAYSGVDVILMPLRIGSGLKGRVLEAMLAGIPVVGTSVAAEGIPVLADTHMAVRDNADGLSVVMLLTDTQSRIAMADAANRLVRERYTWDSTYGRIHECLNVAIDRRALRGRDQ